VEELALHTDSVAIMSSAQRGVYRICPDARHDFGKRLGNSISISMIHSHLAGRDITCGINGEILLTGRTWNIFFLVQIPLREGRESQDRKPDI
jgi:hypothetical protein